MKTTAQRLSEVYCRPKTEEEWADCIPWLKGDPMLSDIAKTSFLAFGDGTISKEPNEGMTEIPVTHFIDLLQDKIVPWRLEEDGFEYASSRNDYYYLSNVLYKGIDVTVDTISNEVKLVEGINEIAFEGGKTYTDLLTLIKLIG